MPSIVSIYGDWFSYLSVSTSNIALCDMMNRELDLIYVYIYWLGVSQLLRNSAKSQCMYTYINVCCGSIVWGLTLLYSRAIFDGNIHEFCWCCNQTCRWDVKACNLIRWTRFWSFFCFYFVIMLIHLKSTLSKL